uniref:Adenylosuccinate synthetase (IMP--aspartate ligase) (AdSS) (AMPSase) n=1 Tax=mine drainage metagenome TaxID=410659 RepID=E6Q196_9ZZZZ
MNGRIDAVLGMQWGDEGKGRIVDWYARDYDVVARFGGGDNAGHRIEVGETKLALRLVPSAALHPTVELFVGSGCVVNLEGALDELARLAEVGVDISRVKFSDRAHLVLPDHGVLDRASESARGAQRIGTTGRGIGPAYADRVSRVGITLGETLDENDFRSRLRAIRAAHERATQDPSIFPDFAEMEERLLGAASRLREAIVDGVAYIHSRLAAGKRILAEGAQGTLLDISFGSYPFVTSSQCTAGGICTGLGVGPSAIGRVIGILKAYTTRVGEGPFPSELRDAAGERLREAGREFGTVTGRPRRCGWFDAVAARYAAALNGAHVVALTKLDVLSGLDRVGIVTGYRRGESVASLAEAGRPDFDVEVEYLEGWSENIGAARRPSDLPEAARRYISRLESLIGLPIELFSVGPERESLIQA